MTDPCRCEWDAADLTGYAERHLRDLLRAHDGREARARAVDWLTTRIAETRTGVPVANAAFAHRTGNPEPFRRHVEAGAICTSYALRAVLFLLDGERDNAAASIARGLDAVAALDAPPHPKVPPLCHTCRTDPPSVHPNRLGLAALDSHARR